MAVVVGVELVGYRRGLAVDLHVFAERAGVRVTLVTAAHLAVVRLV